MMIIFNFRGLSITREEQIKQAVESNLDVSFYTPQDGELLKETFYIGAKWADENPQSPWISVQDDLPCNHEELIENEYYTKKVLSVLAWNDNPSKKRIEVCNMCNTIGPYNTNWYWQNKAYYHVTYWMPLPEPPKE